MQLGNVSLPNNPNALGQPYGGALNGTSPVPAYGGQVIPPNGSGGGGSPRPSSPSSPPSPTAPPPSPGPSGPSAAQVAAAAQAAATAKAEANYHNGLSADQTAIDQGISSGASDYGTSITDAFNGSGGFNSQQRNIDNEGVQNEMSKYQGLQGVRDMVNNGIQGGGVVLDNAGAGTSSAGEALARAYGIQGRQQASKVGVQYAQGQNQIGTEQKNLEDSISNFTQHDAPTKKADIISAVVSNANQALQYLNLAFSSANLPDQINIAQKIADVKAQATAALSAFDGSLATAGLTPMAQGAQQSQAAKMIAQGTAPARDFNYTSTMPAQLQGTGPSASQLPIYLSSAQNKNDNGIPIS